ncbi:type II toxin-antitoxin system PemK/MazF family toxin [Deinococcus sp.]|uniref:type II toxin-antitoxin system PemK/MazF family toxin n=1 Tax=Deinococcus sp. TaxID=47478 RepID=UPI003B5AAC4F
MTDNAAIERGDILLIDFAPAQAGEASFTRPAVVVTNDLANAFSPVLVVVPLTSNLNQVYPFELLLPTALTGLDRESKAQPQLIRHVSRGRVKKHLAHLDAALQRALDERLRLGLGL